MTDDFDDGDVREQLAWEPKTPREQRGSLGNAPLASLRATPATPQATALMGDLAKLYPRPQAAKGKAYARHKTLVDYANAVGAFIADLLVGACKNGVRARMSEGHRTDQSCASEVS